MCARRSENIFFFFFYFADNFTGAKDTKLIKRTFLFVSVYFKNEVAGQDGSSISHVCKLLLYCNN